MHSHPAHGARSILPERDCPILSSYFRATSLCPSPAQMSRELPDILHEKKKGKPMGIDGDFRASMGKDRSNKRVYVRSRDKNKKKCTRVCSVSPRRTFLLFGGGNE